MGVWPILYGVESQISRVGHMTHLLQTKIHYKNRRVLSRNLDHKSIETVTNIMFFPLTKSQKANAIDARCRFA